MALDDVTVGDPHASAHNDERHVINQLELDLGAVAARKIYARSIISDVDVLIGSENAGAWYNIGSVGRPPGATNGMVVVSASIGTNVTHQLYSEYSTTRSWSRTYNPTVSAWAPWKRIDIDEGAVRFDITQSLTPAQKDIAAGNLMGSLSMARGTTTDLDVLYGSENFGSYRYGTGAVGSPATHASASGGLLIAFGGNNTQSAQIAIGHDNTAYFRKQGGTQNISWSDWKRLDIDEGAIRFDRQQTGITETQKYYAKLNAGIAYPGAFLGDLNTLYGYLKAGNYIVTGTGSSNTPVAGQAGVLLVEASASNVALTRQTYSLRDGRTYIRVYNDASSTWGDWRQIGTQDTGWRDVSSLLVATWGKTASSLGRCDLTRVGDLVTLTVHLAPIGAALGTPRTSNAAHALFTMPVGFRPMTVGNVGSAMLWYGAAVLGLVGFHNSGSDLRVYFPLTGATTGVHGTTDQLSFTAVWRTKEVFPTTLPGTPA